MTHGHINDIALFLSDEMNAFMAHGRPEWCIDVKTSRGDNAKCVVEETEVTLATSADPSRRHGENCQGANALINTALIVTAYHWAAANCEI